MVFEAAIRGLVQKVTWAASNFDLAASIQRAVQASREEDDIVVDDATLDVTASSVIPSIPPILSTSAVANGFSSTTSESTNKSQSAKTRRMKLKSKANRAGVHREGPRLPAEYHLNRQTIEKHIMHVVHTPLSTTALPVTKTGYTAIPDRLETSTPAATSTGTKKTTSQKDNTSSNITKINSSRKKAVAKSTAKLRRETVPNRIFQFDEVVGSGSTYDFRLQKWDGCTAMGLTAADGRVFGVAAGQPDDSGWSQLMQNGADLMEQTRSKCKFPKKTGECNRRGPFSALACGVSFGGGQQRPGNLLNNVANTAALLMLIQSAVFIRIAGFATGVFATWAPKLYQHYHDYQSRLHAQHPRLRQNFLNSIWAAATFNFGPATVTLPHLDYGNLAFGWCAITALGNYDPCKGGHLILWNAKLMIEFPPGSTILIPSAVIRHSNVAIQSGERRYSFTQYTAGGLFRWVDQGFCTQANSTAPTAKDGAKWEEGLNMFSTIDELRML